MAVVSHRRALLLATLLPLLLVAAYLWIALGRADVAKAAVPRAAAFDRRELDRQCEFPGTGERRKRLVIGIVDSLRVETALDPKIMPWLAAHRADSLSGRMKPCLSQLSLLCFRTMFEGSEPLLVTGLNNYTGMSVESPSLIHRLAARGVRVAAVADQAFVRLYERSLFRHATFDQREPSSLTRDAFGRKKTFEWLSDPQLDVVISHVIDTDATAHRVGVGQPAYIAKFREADDFLRDVSARLGARDSMIVLGDHGHDAHGYHSTGIPSVTAYFASGPLFPRGSRLDLRMASLYFLAGAVTCEPVPAVYEGEQPLFALRFTDAQNQAFRRASPAPMAVPRALAASLGLDASALACGVLLLVGLLRVLGVSSARSPALGRVPLVLIGLALLWNIASGWLAPWVLVTLQNHVNPTWTIGFMLLLVLVATLLTPLTMRRLALPRSMAFGLTFWAVILFGLFLGPYYYAALRNLLFGTGALIAGAALHSFRAPAASAEPSLGSSALLRWLSLIILPSVPLLFPVLKEWQPNWVMLGFTSALGIAGTAAAAGFSCALAIWLSPERSHSMRTLVSVVVVFALGALTQVPPPVLLGVSLLQWSWFGFWKLAEGLAGRLPRGGLLLPIGQASYALALHFVLLGSLRFANVDFRFALAFTPMDKGEASAALAAIPFVLVKYFLPLLLLFVTGPRLRPLALGFVLLKVLAAGAVLFGMELVAAESVTLFRQLQTQELALLALFYAVLACAFAVTSWLRPNASARELPRAEDGVIA